MAAPPFWSLTVNGAETDCAVFRVDTDRCQIPDVPGFPRRKVADGVGFEPTEAVETSPVFKTGALNRSATHPFSLRLQSGFQDRCNAFA